jgi:hypothetical protein
LTLMNGESYACFQLKMYSDALTAIKMNICGGNYYEL